MSRFGHFTTMPLFDKALYNAKRVRYSSLMRVMSSASTEGRPSPSQPAPMEIYAAEQLRFIRDTMERATVFTAVPGWAGVAIGLTAIAAAGLAQDGTPERQFWIWIAEAFVAVLIGVGGVFWKAKAMEVPLQSRPGRRALLSFLTPLIASAILTLRLYTVHEFGLMAGMWLLLYGAGIIAAGAHSVRVVPVMGCCFAGLGAIALLTGLGDGNVWMALGFGGLHLLFGLVIARGYGG